MDSRTKRVRNRGPKVSIAIITLFLFLIIGLIGLIAIWQFTGKTTIHQGVFIDQTDVGGLDVTQAQKKININNRQRLEEFSLTLFYQENKWVFHHYDIDGSFNTDEAVTKAYNAGREGNLFSQLVSARRIKKEPIRIYTGFQYSEDKLIMQLSKIKELIDKEPVEAQVKFLPDEEEKFVFTPEEKGILLNIDDIINVINQKLEGDVLKLVINCEPEVISPKVTIEDFAGKTEKLISFGTDLSTSATNRTHNVLKAADMFNGMIVKPGQVVSFNGTVGERTAEKGYKNAPMIKADKSLEDVTGGGVSQTSTTLFNAAFRSGLEIVEFTRHSFPSSYIGKGLDTTVNLPTPVIDLKFRNNKSYPIYIRSFYANSKINFEMYGEPLSNDKVIKIRTDEYETVPAPEPNYVEDAEGEYVQYKDEEFEKVKSREGYKVRVYREIYQDDKLLESELFDDHFYRPIKGIIYTGIEERPETAKDNNPADTDIQLKIIETIP